MQYQPDNNKKRTLFALLFCLLANAGPIRAEETSSSSSLRRRLNQQQERQRELPPSSWLFGGSRNNDNNGTLTPRGIGERCNEKNHQCATGLTCLRTPYCFGFLGPRRACFPLDCLAEAVSDLNNAFNMTAYHETAFQLAGVTTDEFFMQDPESQSILRSSSSNTNNRFFGFGKPSPSLLQGYSIVKQMLVSPKVHNVMQVIRDNPVPTPIWSKYESSLAACDPQQKLSKKNRFGVGPTTQGVLGTAGLGLTGGAGIGGGVDFFWAWPNIATDGSEPNFFIDLGGGLIFGADAGPGALIGMTFTGTPADIPGTGFELDLSVPLPIVGPGISVGVDLTQVWDLAFTVTLGAGIAVGGFSAGYTWGFPEGYNQTV